MGKAIVYCQACGKSLREEDFERGRAFRQENSNFCVDCRPELAAPVPRESTPPSTPRKPITDRLAALRPSEVERPGSTSRIPKVPESPERRSPLLWVAIVLVVVVGVLAAIVVSTRSDLRETPSPVVPPPPQAPLPFRPKPAEPTPLERDVLTVRRLLGEPLKGWNTREIEALLKSLAEAPGSPREELDKLRAEYARGLRLLDLREGLLARWSLDEADGAVARDSSGQGHDAKIVGTPGRVPGRIGGAFQFLGPDSYLEAPARGLDARLNGCYTLAAWFMPDALPPESPANDTSYGVVMRSGLHVGLSVTRTGQTELRGWTSDKKPVQVTSGERMTPKVWTHLAGVVDPRKGRSTLFINGRPSGDAVFPVKASHVPLDSPWRIGIAEPKSKDFRWPARGAVDEVLFYGRALDPDEIALLAEGVVPAEADPRRTDPGSSGLLLHLAADRDVKTEGAEALSWSDPARGVEATSIAPDHRPVLGVVGGVPALKFDGKNDRLQIAALPALAFEEKDSFTLAVRVHIAALPAKARWQGIIEKSLEAAPYYGIWLDDRNRWVFGGPQNLHGSVAKPGLALVVAVQDGGKERRLYVDGDRVVTGPAMGANGRGLFFIGGGIVRPEFFDGDILEIRLWRRALDPAEVRGIGK